MNWKLVLQLSLFGLAMGIATVYVIPSNIEPLCWLVILTLTAYIIAVRGPGKPFLHGLAVGLVNSIWITGAHILLSDKYLATHAAEAQMMASAPAGMSVHAMMAVVGPFIGIVSGIVIGVLALIAAKVVRRPVAGDGTPR